MTAAPIMIELGAVMATKSGSVDPSKFTHETFDLYSIPAFDRGEPEIAIGADIGSAKQVVEPGDVLLSKIVPHIRRSWVVGPDRSRRLIASGEWIVFRSARLHPAYLRHVLIGDPFHAQFMRTVSGVGGSLLRARPSHVANIRVPLPPLPEQRRIAEILDRAEALRAKRRAALAQLDTLTQSIFLDIFGDPRQDSTRWPKARIESLIYDMRGGSSLEPEDFVDEGFPILHKGAIKAGGKISIDPKKKTFATREYAQANFKSQVNREFMAVTLRDLVPSGPSIGLVADLRKGQFDEYLLAQGAYGFRLKLSKVLPEYVVQLSNMPNFRHVLRQNAVGSTQIHIRTPIYLGISIPLPPLELQRDFAHKAESIEQIALVQNASDAEFDVLFQSLQYRAFQGEL